MEKYCCPGFIVHALHLTTIEFIGLSPFQIDVINNKAGINYTSFYWFPKYVCWIFFK